MALPRMNLKLEAALRRPDAAAELGDGRPPGGGRRHVAALYAAVHGWAVSPTVWALGIWVAVRCRLGPGVYLKLVAHVAHTAHTIRNSMRMPLIPDVCELSHVAWLLRFAYNLCPKPSDSATQILHSMLGFEDLFAVSMPTADCSYVHYYAVQASDWGSAIEYIGVEQLAAQSLGKTTARIRAALLVRLANSMRKTTDLMVDILFAAIRVDPTYYLPYNHMCCKMLTGGGKVATQDRTLTTWGVWMEATRACVGRDLAELHNYITSILEFAERYNIWPRGPTICLGESDAPAIDCFVQLQRGYTVANIIPKRLIISLLGSKNLWSCRRHCVFDKFTPTHDLFATLMCGLQRLEDDKECAPSHTAMWESALESQWTIEDGRNLLTAFDDDGGDATNDAFNFD